MNNPQTKPETFAQLFHWVFSLFNLAAFVLLVIFATTLSPDAQVRLMNEWVRFFLAFFLIGIIRDIPATVRAVKAEWQKRPWKEAQ